MTDKKEYSIETSLGPIRLIANSDTSLFVQLENIVVNRVPYSGSLRLKVEAGKVSTGNGFYALFLNSRWDGKKFIEASNAAKNKVKAVVIPKVQEYLDANPSILRAAAMLDLANRIEKQGEIVAGLEQQLREAEQVLSELLWTRITE